MSIDRKNWNTCGCCEGLDWLTPLKITNDPGLRALAYRVGTHSSFKESMLRSLSAAPALQELTTREDYDPAIALLDSWAVVLDILTFYQERIANEGFLNTSLERLSLLELARHISYRPKPGLAAGTWLSFLLDDAVGSPTKVLVPAGTKVQSIPGQDEQPQLFETTRKIQARTQWNAIKPKQWEPQILKEGATRLYLQGTDNQLEPGDFILLVGEERLNFPDDKNKKERWDIRKLQNVILNHEENYTLVTWQEGLGQINPDTDDVVYPDTPPASSPHIYVFRQRAALFGHNAPDWRTLSGEVQKKFEKWSDLYLTNPDLKLIYLDAIYPKILEESWIALIKPFYVELYRAEEVMTSSRTKYTLNAQVSRILLDTDEGLSSFGLRDTVVLAQSEELKLTDQPISRPVFGKRLLSENADLDLTSGQPLVISGQLLQYVKVAPQMAVFKVGREEDELVIRDPIYFTPEDNSSERIPLKSGDLLEILEAPEPEEKNKWNWKVKLKDNNQGAIIAKTSDLIPFEKQEKVLDSLLPTSLNAPLVVSELKFIKTIDEETKEIVLEDALKHIYLRHTVTINANVAPATHGETLTEILGNGDGAKIFQQFPLKQKPLTYVSSVSPEGLESTLEIRVNNIKWEEVPSFYGQTGEERIYITKTEDDGTVAVQFGDGITGARLPTGMANVKATYRIGTGLEGMLKADQLSLLMSAQLGLRSVSNPLPPSGAEDPETPENIRQNAPLTVRTLDRVVSIKDFEDFAGAFPGIGKARADLFWGGTESVVYITVAAADEGKVEDTLKNTMLAAINNVRHNNFPVTVGSFEPKPFNIKAKIKVHDDYLEEKVIAQVKDNLKQRYCFVLRNFAQDLSPSEVIAVIQNVEGVVAVDLDEIGGEPYPFTKKKFRLTAQPARWDEKKKRAFSAELLLIDPNKIEIKVMPTS